MTQGGHGLVEQPGEALVQLRGLVKVWQVP